MKLLTRLLLFFCIFCGSSITASAVTASFTADATSGCAPLVVHFTNTSIGATSYAWDLDNGVLTGMTDPSTSYTLPGTYTVKLIAYNGTSSSTYTMTITVYPSPTVSFVASDTATCPGDPITFTSTTVGGVPGPITYIWNFGDGYTSTAATPVHTYTASGYYNITLSATNAMGCIASLTMPAYIHIYNKPIADFSAAKTFFCKLPANAVFTNLSTGTPGLTYKWTFGDGGSSTSISPSHTYTATGAYNVKLVVTDGNGCMDSIQKLGYIYVGTISASFTFPATACGNTVINFPNTSSPHISSDWDFGDGNKSTLDAGKNTYASPGTYTVRLIIFDGGCYDTVTHTITILPKPTGSFTVTPVDPCPAPATLTFTAAVAPGSTVAWKFGDGGTGTGTPTTHTYASNGSDTIKMIITDVNGCIDTVTQVFNIYDLIVEMNHTMTTSGCVPLTVNFSCFAHTTVPDPTTFHFYPYPTVSYLWTFGDGSPSSTAPTPTHVYTAVGVYSAKVVITTANGCTGTATITINVGAPPVANFIAAPTHICANHTVTFTNLSTGADAYKWYFGDGGQSGLKDPVHPYKLPGVYSDTLIAYFRGCPDTFIRTNYIFVDSPAAILLDTPLCTPRRDMIFHNASIGDDSHLWLFGDGNTSTLERGIHTYSAVGTYTIMLTAYNAASGCRDTATALVYIEDPKLDFTVDKPAICRDQYATFTPKITDGTATAYWWVADGKSADTNATVFIDTFYTTGLKTIKLLIRDGMGCIDTLTKVNYLTVAKPVAKITATPMTGCWPLKVTFTDISTDAPGVALTSFAWTFGDGGTGFTTTPSTSHTYLLEGTYTVTTIVTDAVGCKDTNATTKITVWRPKASFAATNFYPCAGDSVFFNNTSPAIVGSFWMFGDGGTSTLVSPWHTYTATGTYTVRLAVTDANGCVDTATYVNYIHVNKPDASFTMSDSFAICPPLLVNFTNTTTSPSVCTYFWDFGGGSTATVPSPSNLYITTGIDTVTLIATDAHGCKDTAYDYIKIFGYAGAFTYDPIRGCTPLTVKFRAELSNVPNIVWDFADGNTGKAAFVDTFVYTYTIPGSYLPKLILSDNTGCENSAVGIDTIKVNGIYPGFKTKPSPVCINAVTNFTDTSRSFFSTITSWEWTFTNGDVSTTNPTPYTYTVAGTYPVTLVVTDGWGCMDTITQNVLVLPPPVITTSADTTICLSDAATLSAAGGVTYSWEPAASVSCTNCNPTKAKPDVATVYTVTGTDQYGCTNTDTVRVSLKYKTSSNATGDTQICRGVVVQLHDTGGTKYTWIPGTGLSSPSVPNPFASPEKTTRYIVVAQLASCQPDTQTVWINVYQLPTVDAGPDQKIVQGSTAQLEATGTLVERYAWDNRDATLSCDTCTNPIASPTITTTYVVRVTSSFGCKNSDSVRVMVFCDQSQMFIPNAFTPNGDGQNDVFYPRGVGVSAVKNFSIYNRWGQLLYQKSNIQLNDPSVAWDGSYQGSAPKPDVYVYVLEATCLTGEDINIKGDVTILR